jgi:hypothetical protein
MSGGGRHLLDHGFIDSTKERPRPRPLPSSVPSGPASSSGARHDQTADRSDGSCCVGTDGSALGCRRRPRRRSKNNFLAPCTSVTLARESVFIPAHRRLRLSRSRCGLVDLVNPCHCGRQIAAREQAGVLRRDDLPLAEHGREEVRIWIDPPGQTARRHRRHRRPLPLRPVCRTGCSLGRPPGAVPGWRSVQATRRWTEGRRWSTMSRAGRPTATCG